MVGSHIDITQSKLAEDSLRSNRTKLMAAQRIQEHLLPRSSPSIPGFDIAGSLHPAEFAAGDHFDYLPMKGEKVGIVIGDVSGHGFDSAISMASVHAYMRLLVTIHDGIEEILSHANALLSQEFEQGRYVTMFFAMLNPATRLLSYVNAGHPAAYILDGNGRLKSEMGSTALPLGLFADAQFPSGADVMLDAGDLVLFMTDGVLEAESSGGILFDSERALEVVRANRQRTAGEIIAALHDAVCHHIGRTTFTDDLTIVVIKALP
jgi:phosphoserine phosphatase RsbU/P